MSYSTHIIKVSQIARETILVRLERPDSFIFEAGQSIDVTIPDLKNTDRYGATRSFSIASAPAEKELEIAMRLRPTTFKKAITSGSFTETIEITGPFGGMLLPRDTDTPLVFIAGGIGITPFRSMLREITLRSLDHSITIFYSNKTSDDATFLEELKEISEQNKKIILITTFTDNSHETKTGALRGRIDKKLLQAHVPNILHSKYYMAGPTRFTTAMKNILIDMNINRTMILNEPFDGY